MFYAVPYSYCSNSHKQEIKLQLRGGYLKEGREAPYKFNFINFRIIELQKLMNIVFRTQPLRWLRNQ